MTFLKYEIILFIVVLGFYYCGHWSESKNVTESGQNILVIIVTVV